MNSRRPSAVRPKLTRRSNPYSKAQGKSFCKCGKAQNARGDCMDEVFESSAPSRSFPYQATMFNDREREDTNPCNTSGMTTNLQTSACPVIELPTISSVTSVSSNSLQIDPAFACRCSECVAFNNRKKNRAKDRCSGYSRSCDGGFCCDKLARHLSTSGMGRDDADKPYIADRYRLNYGNLTLLDVSYFAPKYGFQNLKK